MYRKWLIEWLVEMYEAKHSRPSGRNMRLMCGLLQCPSCADCPNLLRFLLPS